MMERRGYTVTGQVQGVGFRPFVYRVAVACGLTGRVSNTSEGVSLELQGRTEALDAFETRFAAELPPLARMTGMRRAALPLVLQERAFVIADSADGGHGGHGVLVSPDMATCPRCLADMLDPANRRYGYAFTNCTDCGPRYTITRAIPYDRPSTTMACFALCEACRAEYHDPRDRRFHAQPNACPVCGPELWLEADGAVTRGNAVIPVLLEALGKGVIAAVKGLGGFHLVCDAANAGAVAALRRRKNRPHKALAVMVADVETARRVAYISPQAAEALRSPRRPVVVCPRRQAGAFYSPDPASPPLLPLAPLLAPDTADIGLMLPYTPLHHLLFHPEAAGGRAEQALPALVMTSGNAGGEPICLGNREAKARLAGIADVFLFHNRDILVRVDDSVLAPGPDPVMLRRARGFVPEALVLPGEDESTEDLPTQGRAGRRCVLAAGARLKHTFCLTRGREAFVSQHIGDVEHPAALDFFEQTLRHLANLLEVRPDVVVRDRHPDYPSSLLAEEYGRRHGVPVFTLQHHYAHVYAVLAEHPEAWGQGALGIALDGTGLGEDGMIWGGELLWVDPEKLRHRRVGRFAPFPLPGGEAAIREPWRTAEGLWRLAGLPEHGPRPWSRSHGEAVPLLGELLRRGARCPLTTSCGRLFDAVAALCGLCFAATYEGQAAILLENAQDRGGAVEAEAAVRPSWSRVEEGGQELLQLDVVGFFRTLAEEQRAGASAGRLARRFHAGLAEGLADWALAGADLTGARMVALGGGVMNNRTLAEALTAALRIRGLTPLPARRYPPGDGSISLGQAFWARRHMLAGRGNS